MVGKTIQMFILFRYNGYILSHVKRATFPGLKTIENIQGSIRGLWSSEERRNTFKSVLKPIHLDIPSARQKPSEEAAFTVFEA